MKHAIRSPFSDVFSVRDARRRAQRRLPKAVFDYVDGGAEDEVTMERNVAALRELRLRPRVGVWVPEPQLQTSLLGADLSLPVLTAPCGGMRLIHPDGDIGIARAARAAGTVSVASAGSGFCLEEIAEHEPGPKWFQLYKLGGRPGMEQLVERVTAAGSYSAMVLTMDTQVLGQRERDLRNSYNMSKGVDPRTALRLAPQLVRRPGWVARYVRDGMPFEVANMAPVAGTGHAVPLTQLKDVSSATTWDEVAWIREHWHGPLLVKGILTADDARRAVGLGCDGVVVSNHGGRQLDATPSTVEVLPSIAEAVGNEVAVLLDSGVRRGSDVVKAIALGADAVLVGRPCVWGLALGGTAGVLHVLELLRAEIKRTLQLLGCGSIQDLDPSYVAAADGR